MSWWLIALIILLALFLIGRLRVGARIRYSPVGLILAVIVGPARFRVFPVKEKPKKAGMKREKRSERRREKDLQNVAARKPERPGTLSRVMKLLPVMAEAAGALRRKILIHHLNLKVIWGAPDAAAAAIGFGRAYALLGMIWPIFDHNFHVRQHDFQVEVDYEADRPEVAVDLALTMTVGQAVAFVLHYGGKTLVTWSRSGKRSQQRQEA